MKGSYKDKFEKYSKNGLESNVASLRATTEIMYDDINQIKTDIKTIPSIETRSRMNTKFIIVIIVALLALLGGLISKTI